VPFRAIALDTKHQSGFCAGDAGQVELDDGVTLLIREAMKDVLVGGAFERGGHGSAGDSGTIRVFGAGVEFGVFADQPVLGVDQFQVKRGGSGRVGMRRGCRLWRGIRRNGQLQRSGTNFVHDGAMLLFQTQLESLLAVLIEGKQIEVVIGPAVQDAAMVVDRGIEQGMSFATIFGLNVESDVSELKIGVVAKNHIPSAKHPVGVFRFTGGC